MSFSVREVVVMFVDADLFRVGSVSELHVLSLTSFTSLEVCERVISDRRAHFMRFT